jgi:hypothetical protein
MVLKTAGFLFVVANALAQPRFDVASIKPNQSAERMDYGLRGEAGFKSRIRSKSSKSLDQPGSPTDGEPAPETGCLSTAIQEQLGLRLESVMGPVEFLVIDHIVRPLGN